MKVPARIFTLGIVLATFTIHAIPPFGVFYSEDASDTPPWDSGAFLTTLGGNVYLLIGNSQAPSESGQTWPIPSLARFDTDGNLLYSAYMNHNGTALDQELIGDRDDPSRFFAGLLAQDQVAHFSIYEGATLTPERRLLDSLLERARSSSRSMATGHWASRNGLRECGLAP